MGNGKVHFEGADMLKRYSRRAGRLTHFVADLTFPFFPHELLYTVITCSVLDALGFRLLATPVKTLENLLEAVISASPLLHPTSVALVATTFTATLLCAVRAAITLLLYYKGWLFESVTSSPSLPTKFFIVIIGLLSKRARFFSFQGLLPWITPPSVRDTVNTYLETVRPVLNDDEYEKVTLQADEFRKTIGWKLQMKLWMKWLISRNYLSDWWKEVVYMRHRGSLIHTNVACADVIYQTTTTNQAARAAYVTLNYQQFCRELYIENTMKPISLGGIPLCAAQYTDVYRSLRVPRETCDIMIRVPETRHIAVYSNKCWYKVNIFHGKRLIRPAELQRSLQQILDRDDMPHEGEEHLAALTAGPRELWARIHEQKFSEGVNKESLSMIENALEIIFLDGKKTGFDEKDPTLYDYEYKSSITGDGYKLWCDKPSVYTFTKNGRLMSNCEHSVVDALIYVHVREYLKYHEEYERPYGPDGNCIGEVQVVPKPERLRWQLDKETVNAINEAYTFSKGVADDFDNAHCIFHHYGKDFMKRNGISPDAYIQMAIQLAYYKDQGKFELTYEPAVMRLYRDARTETVRSCSKESCQFVNSMFDKSKDNTTRLLLLRKACDRHQAYYRSAMAGKGVDRHLFAMYVVSKHCGIQSPFLDNVFSMNYALSTSQDRADVAFNAFHFVSRRAWCNQTALVLLANKHKAGRLWNKETPQHQMSEYMKVLNKDRHLFWPAGAFCCPEGSNYAVCYTIGATGDIMSFHITSWKSLPHTDARRFCDTIRDCLLEMKSMVEAASN